MAFRTYRAALEYRVGGRTMVNVLHFGGDDGFLATNSLDAQDLAEKLAGGGLVVAWRGLLDAAARMDRVVVSEMLPSTSTDVPESGAATIDAAGTAAFSQNLPLELCGLMNIHTGIAKRYARGHWFLPPLSDESNTASTVIDVSGSYWSKMGDLKTELGHWNKGGSAWSTGGWDDPSWGLGVYSRRRHNLGAATWFFHAKSYTFNTKAHFLRSRGS